MFQRRASRRHSVVSVGSVAHDEEFGPTVQLLLCRATFSAVTFTAADDVRRIRFYNSVIVLSEPRFRLLSIIHAFLGSTPLHMSMGLGLGVQAGRQDRACQPPLLVL